MHEWSTQWHPYARSAERAHARTHVAASERESPFVLRIPRESSVVRRKRNRSRNRIRNRREIARELPRRAIPRSLWIRGRAGPGRSERQVNLTAPKWATAVEVAASDGGRGQAALRACLQIKRLTDAVLGGFRRRPHLEGRTVRRQRRGPMTKATYHSGASAAARASYSTRVTTITIIFIITRNRKTQTSGVFGRTNVAHCTTTSRKEQRCRYRLRATADWRQRRRPPPLRPAVTTSHVVRVKCTE